MTAKQILINFLKSAGKKLLITMVIVLTGSVVLALLLRPTNVEAQTYEPTVEVDSNNISVTDDQADNTAGAEDDMCSDITNPRAKQYCVERAFASEYCGDASDNHCSEEHKNVLGGLLTVAGVLNPSPELSEEQKQSEFWQKIDASIPRLRKEGLLGMATRETFVAMSINPIPVTDAVYTYWANFVPSEVRSFTSNSVNAGFLDFLTIDTLGHPPSSENAFTILRPIIGGWWLSIFKLTTGIFVVVLIASGIMIIFQQKVGQNTVTIYMAIKNLVIGYVGGFLSFGLGAFFFNLSKWLIVVVARLIWSAWPSSLTKHIFYLDAMPGLSWYFAKNTFGAYLTNWVKMQDFSGGFWGAILGTGKLILTLLGGIPGLIIQIGISIYAIVIFTKIFIKVIKIYASMLLDIILAPLIFLMGAIPGNESTIQDWFKRMFKSAIKVPLMFFIVNLGMMFAGLTSLSLKNISGGALNSSVGDAVWITLNFSLLIPLTIIGTANGVDGLIDQMWGGPSKSGAALAQGAKEALKGMPIIGGAMG